MWRKIKSVGSFFFTPVHYFKHVGVYKRGLEYKWCWVRIWSRNVSFNWISNNGNKSGSINSRKELYFKYSTLVNVHLHNVSGDQKHSFCYPSWPTDSNSWGSANNSSHNIPSTMRRHLKKKAKIMVYLDGYTDILLRSGEVTSNSPSTAKPW